MNELDIYAKQGLGRQSGFGLKPALLIVDFVNGFVDPELFGGGNIPAAIEKTRDLLVCARRRAIPVVFTRVVYAADGSDAGVFCLKAPGLRALTEDAAASQLVPQLTPVEGEKVFCKTQPSAFFGTGLAGWLKGKAVDTVLVAGCTTSGCVRASVVDAMSYNFKTIVVTDAVGDRAIGPHEANLFDMGQKYADLRCCTEVTAYLDGIR
ncbi:MAG: isochorismatase family protein [Betaproteobacteria bacterium]|nr:isochorismatase family protein [Betaproteobacteria bacterium]